MDIPQIKIPSAEFYARLDEQINPVVETVAAQNALQQTDGLDSGNDIDTSQQLVTLDPLTDGVLTSTVSQSDVCYTNSTPWSIKKRATFIFSITLANIDGFS